MVGYVRRGETVSCGEEQDRMSREVMAVARGIVRMQWVCFTEETKVWSLLLLRIIEAADEGKYGYLNEIFTGGERG